MNGVWCWDEHFSLSAFLYIFIVNSMTILLKIEYPLKEIVMITGDITQFYKEQ